MSSPAGKTARTARKKVYFLNGPNANLYGLTDKGTYGSDIYATLRSRCQAEAKRLSIALEFRHDQLEVLPEHLKQCRVDARVLVMAN